MDIKKLNEEFEEIFTAEPERLAAENEIAENKAKKRHYLKAVDALEELQSFLEEGIDPATGTLDEETNQFYDRITDLITEIHSRSLAFD